MINLTQQDLKAIAEVIWLAAFSGCFAAIWLVYLGRDFLGWLASRLSRLSAVQRWDARLIESARARHEKRKVAS